jgi:hypothetical protein
VYIYDISSSYIYFFYIYDIYIISYPSYTCRTYIISIIYVGTALIERQGATVCVTHCLQNSLVVVHSRTHPKMLQVSHPGVYHLTLYTYSLWKHHVCNMSHWRVSYCTCTHYGNTICATCHTGVYHTVHVFTMKTLYV